MTLAAFAREVESREARAERIALERVRNELTVRSLPRFVRRFWPLVEPRTVLTWGWYLDALCDHLAAVTRGDILELLISIPPRHLKSTLVSCLWPAWEWLDRPALRYITASYVDDLALTFSVKTRRIIESPEYQELVRHVAHERGEEPWKLSGDQNVKSRYENDRTGMRTAASVGGRLTGHGGDRLILDDPHSTDDADSMNALEATKTWINDTFLSRKNDERTSAVVVIGQRVAKEDASAHFLELGYEHVCLPLVYEADYPFSKPTSLGFQDPRKVEGEPLTERTTPEVIERIKKRGPRHWATQQQQRPDPEGGTIYQRAWFKRYKAPPVEFDEIIVSADLSFKGTKDEELRRVADLSYVVFDAWMLAGADCYLLDEARGQWDFARAVLEFAAFMTRWPDARRVFIEDKANGSALVSIMRKRIPGLIEVEPHGSKIQRAYACQGYAQAGNIHLPSREVAPWIDAADGWLDEVCGFPFRRHNDRVDTMTQTLIHGRVIETNVEAHIERLTAMGMY